MRLMVYHWDGFRPRIKWNQSDPYIHKLDPRQAVSKDL
jgi:hypothetical protein